MKYLVVCLMSLMAFVQTGAAQQSIVSGQVRLSGGLPVAGAQVVLFDLSDLQRGAVAHTTTDATGQFALPLAALGRQALPQGFALGQNYPNPFNPSAIIPYQLAATSQVRLEVFNVLGQRMAMLVDREQGAGAYSAQWDGTDAAGQAVAAGVYVYRLTVDGAQQTRRMVLVDGQAGVPMGGAPVQAMPTGEAPGMAYGLVVSGEGIVAYVDADFRVVAGMESVDIEVAAQPDVRMKVQASGILGDVDNNGRVDLLDALLVAVYYGNPLVVLPNGGFIAFGDVNSDGVVDLTDAYLIGSYVFNPVDPDLPPEIGQPATVTGVGSVGQEMVVSLAEGVEMEFVWIGPGTFMMGSENGESNEKPVHEVQISQGFWLGKYEVTQGQWEAVMGTTPWSGEDHVRSNPSHPAVYISWNDVQRFIDKLNDAAGEVVYRLPSEAEWEYACRAGTSTRWSFGDDESQLGRYAWYRANAWEKNERYGHAVGTKRPNPWGLYDMHGNVWEWVQDWYDSDYYNSSPRVDPPGPSTGSGRVFRGGYVYYGAQALRSAYRSYYPPGDRHFGIGVRLVRIR